MHKHSDYPYFHICCEIPILPQVSRETIGHNEKHLFRLWEGWAVHQFVFILSPSAVSFPHLSSERYQAAATLTHHKYTGFSVNNICCKIKLNFLVVLLFSSPNTPCNVSFPVEVKYTELQTPHSWKRFTDSVLSVSYAIPLNKMKTLILDSLYTSRSNNCFKHWQILIFISAFNPDKGKLLVHFHLHCEYPRASPNKLPVKKHNTASCFNTLNFSVAWSPTQQHFVALFSPECKGLGLFPH